jgi:hypothetical protein
MADKLQKPNYHISFLDILSILVTVELFAVIMYNIYLFIKLVF